jgi:hypothetical protein
MSQPTQYSPVQFVKGVVCSYLFFVRDGELRCTRYNSSKPSNATREFTMPVYKEPFVGFSAHEEDTGAVYCLIQKADGTFATMLSEDSGMMWRPE